METCLAFDKKQVLPWVDYCEVHFTDLAKAAGASASMHLSFHVAGNEH